MKHFKKRTIALVLASLVTVAGSFAAQNYRNSLMSLKFDTAANGAVTMSVETKTPYTGNVSPVRRDNNTYILTLSEMNNFVNGNIQLDKVTGNIESVDVKTLPYTNNAKGYTRITIKTYNPVNIIGHNKIFIPSENQEQGMLTASKPQESINNEPKVSETNKVTETRFIEEPQPIVSRPKPVEEVVSESKKPAENNSENNFVSDSSDVSESTPISNQTSDYETKDKDPFEALLLVLGILFVLSATAAFGVRAKNKLQEITGEKIDIDVSEDEEENPKETKRKQIKKAINKLDAAYSKTAVMPPRSEYTAAKAPVKTTKPAEELNVVDLDELFKEQQVKTKIEERKVDVGEENIALEDFLSEFSFDEESERQENTSSYDEDYYQKVLNKKELSFTENDITCINKLLNNEIDDEVLKNKEQFVQASSKPKVTKSPQEVLEELLLTYKISQNITFTQDDVDALKKLISVEIDHDFITDLRTNPERTKQIQAEIIAAKNKPHYKPSEILTLNVKDMLPDLSEALKKQGNRRIESEVKPITIYASEGYEVSTLTLNTTMPDLSKEIHNKAAYVEQPSAAYDIVDNSYEVETLRLKDAMPDLSEAIKNPKNFEHPEPEPVEIDEESLLKNITNVQFKPFDDGSRKFEVLNDIEPPSIEDIQNELNQFGNLETYNNDEEYSNHANNNGFDDFESLFNNEYLDLDNSQEELSLPKLEKIADENTGADVKRFRTKSAEEIIKKIEETKSAKAEKQEKLLEQQKNTKAEVEAEIEEVQKPQAKIKCILDGITYNVLSTTEFSENKGCHLAKSNNGYAVLGYIDDKFLKITEFENLKSERILSRLSEKLPDGSDRYIIRIGLNKFMVNVSDNDIEYMITL